MVVALQHYIKKVTVLYDTETKELIGVSNKDVRLLKNYGALQGFIDETKEIVYTTPTKLLSCTDRQIKTLDLDDYLKAQYRYTTGDFILDMFLINSNNMVGVDLQDFITNRKQQLSAHMPVCIDEKSQAKFDRKVPKKQELTWKELEAYESQAGSYVLVNNIRTRKLYSVPSSLILDSSNITLNREFIETEYEVIDNHVIFKDKVETTLGELACSVDTTEKYALDTYRTALELVNSGVLPTMLRLNMGDSLSYPAYSAYTILHNTGYMRVQPRNKTKHATYLLDDWEAKSRYIQASPFEIHTIPRQDYFKLDKQNFTLEALSLDSICTNQPPFSSYNCIGIHHIGVTEKGYDIRVLAYKNTYQAIGKRKLTFYSLPLMCAGLVAERQNEGYVIYLTLQTITLSKSIYENLVCVGNGEKAFTINSTTF